MNNRDLLIIFIVLSILMFFFAIHNIITAFDLVEIQRDICLQSSYYNLYHTDMFENYVRPKIIHSNNIYLLILSTIPLNFGFLFTIIVMTIKNKGDENGNKGYRRSAQ